MSDLERDTIIINTNVVIGMQIPIPLKIMPYTVARPNKQSRIPTITATIITKTPHPTPVTSSYSRNSL